MLLQENLGHLPFCLLLGKFPTVGPLVIVPGYIQVLFCGCPEVILQGNLGGCFHYIEQSIGGLFKFTLNISFYGQTDKIENAQAGNYQNQEKNAGVTDEQLGPDVELK
jgi:hypothetical protein